MELEFSIISDATSFKEIVTRALSQSEEDFKKFTYRLPQRVSRKIFKEIPNTLHKMKTSEKNPELRKRLVLVEDSLNKEIEKYKEVH